MAVTTTRLRHQAAGKRRMVALYTKNGATNAARECEREAEDIERQIAEREGKVARECDSCTHNIVVDDEDGLHHDEHGHVVCDDCWKGH